MPNSGGFRHGLLGNGRGVGLTHNQIADMQPGQAVAKVLIAQTVPNAIRFLTPVRLRCLRMLEHPERRRFQSLIMIQVERARVVPEETA